MKYACETPEICPRRVVRISLPLLQTGEVMSLRLISTICAFFSYYSHCHYLYPCRQREGLVRKYLFVSIAVSFGQYISLFWQLRCLAVAHSVDHWTVTTDDRVQFQAIRCWICSWHSDIGTCCLPSFRFTLPVSFDQCYKIINLQRYITFAKTPSSNKALPFYFILLFRAPPLDWLAGINNHSALQSMIEYLFLQIRRILKYFNLCAEFSPAKNYSCGSEAL
jgi:hypothetical protein